MKTKSYDKDKLINEYLNHKSLSNLSKLFNMDKRTIKKILLKHGYVIKRNIISTEIEANIINDYLNNISVTLIMKKYETSREKILKILSNNNIKNRGNLKFNFNRRIFETIDNEKKAYWLGFLYADGSVYKSKNNILNHVTIKLSSKDSNHLLKFKNDFNLPHDIKLRKEYTFNKNFESARIRIISVEMVNDLIKNGCIPNKTFLLQFPNISENLYNHFIRGYFDGDGSISNIKNDKQITILGNYSFLTKIQEILIKNCNINKTKISKKNNIYYLHYGGNLNIKKIGEFLYSNSTTFLDRKRDKFEL